MVEESEITSARAFTIRPAGIDSGDTTSSVKIGLVEKGPFMHCRFIASHSAVPQAIMIFVARSEISFVDCADFLINANNEARCRFHF